MNGKGKKGFKMDGRSPSFKYESEKRQHQRRIQEPLLDEFYLESFHKFFKEEAQENFHVQNYFKEEFHIPKRSSIARFNTCDGSGEIIVDGLYNEKVSDNYLRDWEHIKIVIPKYLKRNTLKVKIGVKDLWKENSDFEYANIPLCKTQRLYYAGHTVTILFNNLKAGIIRIFLNWKKKEGL